VAGQQAVELTMRYLAHMLLRGEGISCFFFVAKVFRTLSCPFPFSCFCVILALRTCTLIRMPACSSCQKARFNCTKLSWSFTKPKKKTGPFQVHEVVWVIHKAYLNLIRREVCAGVCAIYVNTQNCVTWKNINKLINLIRREVCAGVRAMYVYTPRERVGDEIPSSGVCGMCKCYIRT